MSKLYFISFRTGSKSHANMTNRLDFLLSSDESPLEGVLDDGSETLKYLIEDIISIEDIEVYSIPDKYQENPEGFMMDYMEDYIPMTRVFPK